MKQLHLYVDETGQDTKGEFFLVAVVIVERHFREQAERFCQQIEIRTGKRTKWTKTKKIIRWTYIEEVLQAEVQGMSIKIVEFRDTGMRYLDMMTHALYEVLRQFGEEKALRIKIYVDALSKTQAKEIGAELRQRLQNTRQPGRGIWGLSVRGIRTEASSALLRLADGLCGFARAVVQKEPHAITLWRKYGHRLHWIEVKQKKAAGLRPTAPPKPG